ncbi:MAG: polysaccharide biosynthesis/export family protein, partial [Flavobacteriaceae bacterium]
TVQEIRSLVQREVDKYLVNAKVMVQLTSFKVSVLGDVKNPGTNYIYNSESTIFEALGTAGDLNISANRKMVKLIRQVDDKSVVVTLDLTDPMVIQSPYYFLHPNDVIYVETSKQNIVRNNFSVATLVLTAISTGLLIWNLAAN